MKLLSPCKFTGHTCKFLTVDLSAIENKVDKAYGVQTLKKKRFTNKRDEISTIRINYGFSEKEITADRVVHLTERSK